MTRFGWLYAYALAFAIGVVLVFAGNTGSKNSFVAGLGEGIVGGSTALFINELAQYRKRKDSK